jgi:hypothetical protein
MDSKCAVKEPCAIVNIHNKNDTYYLTSRTIYRSAAKEDINTMFLDAIVMNRQTFNKTHNLSAYIQPNSVSPNPEAVDLYLNVNPEALRYVIDYIQRGEINGPAIYSNCYEMVGEISNLAAIFGMPLLSKLLQELEPDPAEIEPYAEIVHNLAKYCMLVAKTHDIDCANDSNEILAEFFKKHDKEITDYLFKRTYYQRTPLFNDLIMLLIDLFARPHIIKKMMRQTYHPGGPSEGPSAHNE